MGKGKRARKRAAGAVAKAVEEGFFLDFRRELARYAEGVHWLGEPATQAEVDAAVAAVPVPLPAELRSFLRSWNGAELFHETWV
ncbi:MAG TPA: hypothetical protein VFX50_06240, partial [Gemmatimonadales bacterium]|nr:hypothetical protein [Gemmatimonadales bacterium]